MKRLPLGIAATLLAVLVVLVLRTRAGREKSATNPPHTGVFQSTGVSSRDPMESGPDEPSSSPGSAVPSTDLTPPGSPALEAALDCLREWERKVDQEGANVLLHAASTEETFLVQIHAEECREEILRLCRDRGGIHDPLVSFLSALLEPEAREELHRQLDKQFAERLARYEEGEDGPARALLRMAQDPTLPLGQRTDALMRLSLSPEGADPELRPLLLEMLDAAREPILRTLLYRQVTGFDGQSPLRPDDLERALGALEAGAERRGTAAEVARCLQVFFERPDVPELREQFGARIADALFRRFLAEARRETPDEALLGMVSSAVAGWSGVPTREQESGLVAMLSNPSPKLRSAAVRFLTPDLAERMSEPAARTFVARVRDPLIRTLRNEPDLPVASDLIQGLSRVEDAETNLLLAQVARERPDLRTLIESALGVPEPR